MEIKTAFQKPYIFWILGISLLYFALNIFLSKFYVTVQYIPQYFETLNWVLLFLSFLLSVGIAFLVAVNMVFGYLVYHEKKNCEKKKLHASLPVFGAVAGLSTGICSACVGSVFPAVFGLFGVTLSWAALPFKGAEVQGVLIALLGANLYYLNKNYNGGIKQ